MRRDGRAETPAGGMVTCSLPFGDVVIEVPQHEAREIARTLDDTCLLPAMRIASAIYTALGDEEDSS